MSVFITGGHPTPAIAVIDELQKLAPKLPIYFIGRTHAMEGDEAQSLEYYAVTGRGIQFLPITTGRLPRYLSPTLFWSIVKLPVGFIQALWYVFRLRPSIVLSFGGYVSFPVCVGAFLAHIPIIIHEQGKEPGLSNKIIARVASKIFVSFREHATIFPPEKTLYTGLPLRTILFHPPKEPSFPYEKNIPLIYITGGATGAVSLNALIFPIIGDLSKKYMIIHQTGSRSYDQASLIGSSHYYSTPSLGESDVSWVYQHATLVVGRSGANTVGEIAALGKIALFVPLPWSAGNEQEKNAKILVDNGSATMLSQKSLTPEKLLAAISLMVQKKEIYQKNAREFSAHWPTNAATIIAKELIHSARTS